MVTNRQQQYQQKNILPLDVMLKQGCDSLWSLKTLAPQRVGGSPKSVQNPQPCSLHLAT